MLPKQAEQLKSHPPPAYIILGNSPPKNKTKRWKIATRSAKSSIFTCYFVIFMNL